MRYFQEKAPMKVVSISSFSKSSKMHIPLYSTSISAGFPSPAESYVEKKIDLNKELIEHPAATFFVRVEGDSMEGAGIQNQDILIVDRSLEALSNKVVVAVVQGEFTVKRLKKEKGRIFLLPENLKYKPLEITKEMDFSIWGIVTYAIHSF